MDNPSFEKCIVTDFNPIKTISSNIYENSFWKSVVSIYILLVKVLFVCLYVGISPQRKAQILKFLFMEELFHSIEDLWVGLRSLSGRSLNVLADSLAKVLRLRCATFWWRPYHIFGEDLMANSIFFCHFQQSNPWGQFPYCGSPLSFLLLPGRWSHRRVTSMKWAHHHHHPTLLSFFHQS